jgi:hypothetical protein
MGEARCHVTFPRFPSARHSGRREILHFGWEIRTIPLVHEVQDRHRRIARFRKTTAYLDVAARSRRKTLTEQRYHAPEIMNTTHYSDVPRRAAKPPVTAGNRVVSIDRKA